MDISNINSVYFIGVGGIGMSAIARYFLSQGKVVAGYDRTPSELTNRLVQEGAQIHYEEDVNQIPSACKTKEDTLVVYTPAIPSEHQELAWFREQGFEIQKRAQVLGTITRSAKALCVAGTHGKTTTSTMLAHLMNSMPEGCNAFLGGIAKNYGTNYILSENSPWVVIEADEFDRSFHHLSPYITAITSTDPDHLDIYGTEEAYSESFAHYASLVQEALVVKKNIASRLSPLDSSPYRLFTYAVDEQADFFADNIRVEEGQIYFDFHTPDTQYPISNIRLGVPVWVNIENSVAAMAVAWLVGATEEELRQGVSSFAGVFRRFNIHLNTPQITYIDDYAHHPQELAATIESVRRLYPDRYVIGVFQPHLFSRTRDFADAFAEVLSLLDEVALLPIYPAREQPIEGVNSEWLMDKIIVKRALVLPTILPKYLRERLKSCLAADKKVVVITMGAGDIERQVNEITHKLTYKIL